MPSKLSVTALLAAACCTAAGCGEATAPTLRGAVTYDGQPLPSGSIMFVPTSRGSAPFGAEIKNGAYVADKALVGEFTALIRAGQASTGPVTHEQSEEASRARSAGGAGPTIAENAPGNSQKVQITGGDQTLDFAIKGPAG